MISFSSASDLQTDDANPAHLPSFPPSLACRFLWRCETAELSAAPRARPDLDGGRGSKIVTDYVRVRVEILFISLSHAADTEYKATLFARL